MNRSPDQLRNIATAMLIMGFAVELIGIALLLMDRPVSAVVGVLVAGMLLLMMGVVFLSQLRR